MTYFYNLNGTQQGPVTEEELRGLVSTGVIQATTPVWREGMADWQPYRDVLGAAGLASGATVECGVCHQKFPPTETIRYGTVNVCAGCKPRFMQGLREGASTPGMLEYAGIGARFGAKFLDGIIMGVINMGIVLVATFAFRDNPVLIQAAGLGTNLLAIIYQAIFLSWRGQTLGKMALGIKVVRPDGSDIGTGQAIGRPFAELLSGCTLMIGFIIAFWDPEKRTLHDRLAGTRVIKLRK